MAKHRVHSVNFDVPADVWLESMVELLRAAGISKAGRSEIVRVALETLRHTLAGRTRADIVKYFLEWNAERRLAQLDQKESESADG